MYVPNKSRLGLKVNTHALYGDIIIPLTRALQNLLYFKFNDNQKFGNPALYIAFLVMKMGAKLRLILWNSLIYVRISYILVTWQQAASM